MLLLPRTMFKVTLANYLQQIVYLTLTVGLLAGCGRTQVESIPTPPLVPPTSTPTPTLIQHTRDYWPTEGWIVSIPAEQGIDPEQLQKFQQHIEAELPHINSVLIVRRGYLVFEQYYQGYSPNVKQPVESVTKSITSALIGIALQEGHLDSLDQEIADFFPEYVTPELDLQVQEITVKHLLTMTSGFEWSNMIWAATTRNPIQYAIERPMAHQPGQQFNYDTPASHILSGILAKATQMSALEFADQHLFGPLGISDRFWAVDPQGNNFGSHLLSLRPRDMAKFGYLYLNNGYWEGKQIIPVQYVRESTSQQIKANHPFYEEIGYGYLWWTTTVEGHSAYFASGFGGQLIYVVPDLDLVVVITSMADSSRESALIIDEFIIPAISE